MRKLNSQIKGTLFVLISALGFGAMGMIATIASSQGINTDTLLSFRFLIAALIFAAFLFVRKISFKVNVKQTLLFVLLGMIGYAAMSTLLYESFKLVSVPVAVLVLYTYPAIVMLLSILLGKEVLTFQKGFSLVAAGIGLILVMQISDGFNMRGTLYAFSSAILYAFFVLISNKYTANDDSLLKSMYISLFASVGLFAMGFQSSAISLPETVSGWGIILSLALISTVLPFFFFFEGLQMVGATKASILSMLEPVFAVVLSAIFLGEHLSLLQWFGMVIVIFSSLLVSVNPAELFPKRYAPVNKRA
ncbi:Threonine/homoserine efflux transporter RhtA [Bacillus sp. cl95]|uniref:DMT family transporter n=1 Tax=Bacillus sp. UNCCL13 TaxID=1502772 RepID=UPI0008DF6EEC|nr:EamA family transporter [Bacillus sp. UNCCL13]SFA86744.1 Threonine/homoserine efflux transporter RhtA [Bacillus sp. UNCCL13]SFQ83848.1 Threonine/homoserine efflux transporter RhtA [Bacillus sp. cl95]